MIVDPDFMDHWRTGMVADAIGDPMAPVYILRLWAHCQGRKSDRFVMPTAGLKAQCRAPVDAKLFEQALIEAGFIQRDGETIIVTGWAEKNASLIAAWDNGSKGGRPKKNQEEAKTEPTGNPPETQTEPGDDPAATQPKPIRVDKSREDKTEEEKKEQPVRASRSALIPCPADVSPQVWADWHQLRKAKKAPVTQTVLDSAKAEAVKAALTLEKFLKVWCARGSQGLEAEWLKPHERGSPSGGPPKTPGPRNSGHAGFDETDYSKGVNDDGTLA